MATLGIPDLDPLTGLPRKKQQSMFAPTDQSQVPGLPAGVTNGNLASTLYGTPTLTGAAPQTGGGAPNPFQSLLDSLLGSFKANQGAQQVTDVAGRNAAINRAVVQFGALPDTAAASKTLGLDLGSVLSPDTAQLATQNQFSTSRQLDQANTDAIRQIRRSLAAKGPGALQSGDLGYYLQKQQDSYSQAKYNASQQLLDYLAGVQQAYVASEQQRQQALQAQQFDYAQLIASLFPNGYPGDTTPAPSAPAAPQAQPEAQSNPAPVRPSIPLSVSGYLSPVIPPSVSGTFDRVLPNAYNTNKNKRG